MKFPNYQPVTCCAPPLPQAAGFSLGEYTALVYAGALSFEDGMKVVKARAEAMHAAAQPWHAQGRPLSHEAVLPSMPPLLLQQINL